MTKREMRTTAMWMGPEGAEMFHEMAWLVQICDEGGGEFIELTDGEGQTIKIDPDEWEDLSALITAMVGQCREQA